MGVGAEGSGEGVCVVALSGAVVGVSDLAVCFGGHGFREYVSRSTEVIGGPEGDKAVRLGCVFPNPAWLVDLELC